jgi:hypothetical protein
MILILYTPASRARGKCCHRPRKNVDLAQAEFYLSKGVGVSKTARILRVAPNTLRSRIRKTTTTQ